MEKKSENQSNLNWLQKVCSFFGNAFLGSLKSDILVMSTKIDRIETDVKEMRENTKDTTNKIISINNEVLKTNKDVERVFDSCESFKDSHEKYGNRLKAVENFMLKLYTIVLTGGDVSKIPVAGLLEENSPLNLTPLGKQKLEEIGFVDDVNNNIESLIKQIDQSNPKSALDVEVICIGLIRYSVLDSTSTIFKKSEDFIYNNPEFNNPSYFKATGVYLRDKYLEKHPELLPK